MWISNKRCVCVHIETKLYKNMIKLSNHDHCNKFSLNNKKNHGASHENLYEAPSEGGHRCVDPTVQSSIQVSPSTLLKFSIHEDFSCSSSSCWKNGPNGKDSPKRFQKNPKKNQVWEEALPKSLLSPMVYGPVYLYHIFQTAFFHIQNLTSRGTSRKNNHKSNATTIYGHVSPQNDLLLRRLEKLSYCTSKMSMVQTCNLPWYQVNNYSKWFQQIKYYV